MTTDFRALCAKVLAYNEGQGTYNFSHLNAYDRDNAAFDAWQEIKAELKSALAEPEPEGPTPQPVDGEAAELVTWLRERGQERETLHLPGAELSKQLRTAPFLLTRAADLLERLAPQPIAVSERLPGPWDCDAEGRCWWFCFECPGEHSYWILAKEVYCDPALWLPAHALPQPS